jgi:hypothetical protein
MIGASKLMRRRNKTLFKKKVFGKSCAVTAFEELPMLISSHTGIVSIEELSDGCNCVSVGWRLAEYRGLNSAYIH